MYAPLEMLRVIPGLLLAQRLEGNRDHRPCSRVVPLIDLQENDTSKRVYGAAVDLGSTTVVVYLWDLVTGKVVAVASNYNKQISGEDILAR